MKLVCIRRNQAKLITLISIAVVLLNIFTLRYLAADELDVVNMAALSGRIIALDPGHGGIDGGAYWNGIKEKDITFTIALKLADILKANEAQVVLTREGDVDYYTRGKGGKRNDLMKRVEIITDSGAEVFISIHANATKGGKWSGAEVWYSPKRPENKTLAEIMQRALKDFPPGNKRHPKQDSDIIVLNETPVTGVLIEVGFLSNKEEALRLANGDYQQKIAEHIAKALAYHFSQNAGR